MKIGIGITSFNRLEHLELCVKQILNYIHWKFLDFDKITMNEYEGKDIHSNDYKIFIAKDITNIAKAKNECLYALKDCDHIFLFDDDCFPINDLWIQYFIEWNKNGYDHLLYLTERHKHIGSKGCPMYEDCGGCFMYISKSALEQVGYFNTEYKQYGFEHAGWSKRFEINNGSRYFHSLHDINKYLYSLDYQGEGNWGIKHKSSITDYKVMQESIDYNRKVFEKEISGDKIYYDYKP